MVASVSDRDALLKQADQEARDQIELMRREKTRAYEVRPRDCALAQTTPPSFARTPLLPAMDPIYFSAPMLCVKVPALSNC